MRADSYNASDPVYALSSWSSCLTSSDFGSILSRSCHRASPVKQTLIRWRGIDLTATSSSTYFFCASSLLVPLTLFQESLCVIVSRATWQRRMR